MSNELAAASSETRASETARGDGATPFVAFFKVLANESRLRILGLLAEHPASVSHIADAVGLREPTVSHHLARLRELNLVAMEPRGNVHLYSLNHDALTAMKRDLLSDDSLTRFAPRAIDGRTKILRTFVTNGRLRQIPASRKKREVVLRWLVSTLDPHRRYTEQQLNATLAEVYTDTATLRRELVGYGLMSRDMGLYWCNEMPEPVDYTEVE